MKVKNIPHDIVIDAQSWTMNSQFDGQAIKEAEVYHESPNSNKSLVIPNNPLNVYLEEFARMNTYTAGIRLSYELGGVRYYSTFLLHHFLDALKNGRIANGVFNGSFVFGKIPGYTRLSLIEVGSKLHTDLVLCDDCISLKVIPQKNLNPGKVYLNNRGQKIAYFGLFEYPKEKYYFTTKQSETLYETANYFMNFDTYSKDKISTLPNLYNLRIQKTTNFVKELNETCDYEILRKLWKNSGNYSSGGYKMYLDCVRKN